MGRITQGCFSCPELYVPQWNHANAVYLAKYRVLRRLRQEIEGLTD